MKEKGGVAVAAINSLTFDVLIVVTVFALLISTIKHLVASLSPEINNAPTIKMPSVKVNTAIVILCLVTAGVGLGFLTNMFKLLVEMRFVAHVTGGYVAEIASMTPEVFLETYKDSGFILENPDHQINLVKNAIADVNFAYAKSIRLVALSAVLFGVLLFVLELCRQARPGIKTEVIQNRENYEITKPC